MVPALEVLLLAVLLEVAVLVSILPAARGALEVCMDRNRKNNDKKRGVYLALLNDLE
jgi:hypothetical protein